MGWRRVASLVALVIVAIVAITVAPLDQGPAAASRYAFIDVMSPSKQDAYLKAHPGAEVGLLNLHPTIVASMWRSYSKRERHDAAKSYPALVGQLEGVDYVSRDLANRTWLRSLLASTRQKVKAHPSDVAAQQKLRCLTAIAAALKPHTPRRYLVELTNDAKPLAAISIGDLDTADIVSFAVPGMGTYTDDMQLWAQGAQNVYDAQDAVAEGAHLTARHAVVAWIGYETPPPGIDAALGDYAHIGAQNLIGAVKGFWAARGKGAQDEIALNVIAHSYGTTMSADALAAADLNVYAFVMLGSAGIEDGIGTASRLHAQHVYAGEAKDDTDARWGRVSRIDPRSPSFGAIPLAVDGNEQKEQLPVTGHDPILHSSWNDDPTSSAWAKFTNAAESAKRFLDHTHTYGYLDAGTESVSNVAAVTVPLPKDTHDSTVSPRN